MSTINELKGRVRLVDAIRGFSLLGILIANMLIFQYGLYGKEMIEKFNVSSLDIVLHKLLVVFVEGSFMPIFMFLFGYGFYKLYESLRSNGFKPWRSFIRRQSMLLVIGLLHSFLLWEGDILAAYGLIGITLLFFVKRKAKTLIICGIILTVILSGLAYGGWIEMTDEEMKINEYVDRSIPIYAEGSYAEIIHFRMNEDPLDLSGSETIIVLLLAPVILAPMFLLGIAAGNKKWFHNPQRERRRYASAAALLLPSGLLLKSLGVWQSDTAWSGVVMSAGGPLLALGYIFGAAFILSSLSQQMAIIRGFVAVGRMSLTNYLMQTVVCTTIFYGYGFGLFGKIGVLGGILLSVLIYSVQMVVSVLLLTVFKQGPLEYVLRIWTYWSLRGQQKLMRKPNISSSAEV